MIPESPLARQLDIAHDNLHPDYMRHIFRAQFNTYAQFEELGKQVEQCNARINAYKPPPPENKAFVHAAAFKTGKANTAQQQPKQQQQQQKAAPVSETAAANETVQQSQKQGNKQQQQPQQKKADKQQSGKQNSSAAALEFADKMPPPGCCFKCRKPGHLHEKCPNDGLKFFCYGCGYADVTANRCPNTKNHPRKTKSENRSGILCPRFGSPTKID